MRRGGNFTLSSNSGSSNDLYVQSLGVNGNLATTFLTSSGTTITDADVRVNTSYLFDETFPIAADRYALASVLSHEFGHFIGIDHSGDSSALMWSTIPIGTWKTLQSDDWSAKDAIY